MITAVSLPINWTSLGFPARPDLGGVGLVTGPVGWRWSEAAPDLGISSFPSVAHELVPGWSVDHVVLLTGDLDLTVHILGEAGFTPRRYGRVREQPAAFFRVGPVLEVIETGTGHDLFGVALACTEPLDSVVARWRDRGATVTDPRPAVQAGRSIFIVKHAGAGLAVMSAL